MWIPNGLHPSCGKCSHSRRTFPTYSCLWLSATRKPSHQSAKLHCQVYSHTVVCHQGSREEEGRGKVSFFFIFTSVCQEPLLVFLWGGKQTSACFSLIWFIIYEGIDIWIYILISGWIEEDGKFPSFTAYWHVCSYWGHNTPFTLHYTEMHTHARTHTHNCLACIQCTLTQRHQCQCLHFIMRTWSRHAKCTSGIQTEAYLSSSSFHYFFHWEANQQTKCRLSQLSWLQQVSRPNFNSEPNRGDCGGVCRIMDLPRDLGLLSQFINKIFLLVIRELLLFCGHWYALYFLMVFCRPIKANMGFLFGVIVKFYTLSRSPTAFQ